MAARRRTGVAAILAGALVFAGQGGELVFGSPWDAVDAVFVALWAGGVDALGARSQACGRFYAAPAPGR
jgi:hypothetical protein